VVGDQLYTMYAATVGEESLEFAAAFGTTDGKEIWRTKIGEKLDTDFGNGPRSTPLVDGESVYVLGSYGDLAALSTIDGTARWTLSLTEVFGSSRPYWGFSTSAVLEGDLLIVEGGGPEGKSYSGLNKKTGEIVWTSGEGPPGHNSPLPIDLQGQRQIVYVTQGMLRAIDTEGKELWTHVWPQGETHAMPLFIAPDKIFASGVESVGAALLQITKADGQWQAKELWHDRVMRNHFSSSIFHGGYLFGFDNATLKCIDPISGTMKWGKRGLGKGSLIYADGHLLVLSDRGRLLLVEATSEGYLEKGSLQALTGRTWTAPTVAGNRLYLRDHTQMVSYDLTASGEEQH
jgi:outer membrane protein assembly factor BamB